MYKCDICKQEYNYIDEFIFKDCNGYDVIPEENEINNPDNPDNNVITICNICYEYIK